MLQQLRDQTQGTGFKILVGAIIVVLTLFGFGATNLFLGGDPEVARVGDYSITQGVLTVEMERERRRILAQMGPDFDESSIDPLQLSEYVTQQVVNRQIMYQTAGELGIEIPPEEVNSALVASEAYQVDGSFSEPVYRQFLQMMGYTPVAFVREYTSALSSEKVQRAVGESIAMTDWELAEIVRVLNQTRDFAYLPLDIADYLGQVEVTQDEIETRYDEESSEYLTELAIDVSYISMSVDDLVDDPSIIVVEDDLIGLYEEEKAASLRSERRASSHILIQVNDERNESSAQDLITEVATRLAEGEEFAALAEELSEDAGSAGEGGRLDAVGKGIFDPAFEDALWSLGEPGSISDPVRSDFGFHIIRLDSIEQEDYPTLDSQRDELVAKVRRGQAAELFAEQARQLEDNAYEEQSSLSETAATAGVAISNVEGVMRSELSEGPLSHASIVSALFSDDVLAGNNSEGIVLGEEEIIFVRVDEQYPPELKPLEAVEAEIQATIEREKALVLVDEHKAQGLAQLEAGVSVTEIAQSLGASWVQVDRATRTPQTSALAEIPPPVLAQAFTLPRPGVGEKSVGIAEYGQGAALVTVTSVTQGDINATAQAEVTELRRVVEGRSGRLELQSFLQAAENELGVERPPSVLPST
ncbi:MAG: hypothetical protein GKR90_04600 [Pseudomonadales bacterium]|nr:hypothetical protein [Pseudomonadales bacterium]